MITAYERMVVRRYLTPGRGRTGGEGFIFLVAGISLVAVAIGVAALIAVMSVMNGFRAELFDRMVGLNGHAVVQGYGGKLNDWQQVMREAKAQPGVTAALPLIEQPLIGSFGGRVEGVIVRGLRLADIKGNPTLAGNVRGGSLDALKPGAGTVAIGARLAEQLGLRVGDQISLINPAGQSSPFGTVPRIVAYTVAAVFEVGLYDYDKLFVIMPLEDAQTLLRLDAAVGMIEVVTENPDTVARTLAPLKQQLAGIAVINTWQDSNAALFSALVVEQTVMFWVLSIIIVVAVFNILSSLIMLVRAKTRDIAILRTMGASRAALMRVFVGVGTLIGAAGVAAGLVLGFTLLTFRQPIVDGVSRLTGTDIWDPSVRYLTLLPAKTDPMEVVSIVVLALLLSFLATLYPAWKAASTDPVTVLRYE